MEKTDADKALEEMVEIAQAAGEYDDTDSDMFYQEDLYDDDGGLFSSDIEAIDNSDMSDNFKELAKDFEKCWHKHSEDFRAGNEHREELNGRVRELNDLQLDSLKDSSKEEHTKDKEDIMDITRKFCQ